MKILYCISAILLFLLIIETIIYFSKLEIEMLGFSVCSENKSNNNKNILIKISLKLGRIKYISIKINKEKLAGIFAKIQEQEAKMDMKKMKEKMQNEIKLILGSKEIRKQILNIRPDLEKLKMNLKLGTEDYIITSYLIAICSIIISNILPHIIKKQDNIKKVQYKIKPIYNSKNMYLIEIDTKFNAKISKISNALLTLLRLNMQKKRENEKQKLYKELLN